MKKISYSTGCCAMLKQIKRMLLGIAILLLCILLTQMAFEMGIVTIPVGIAAFVMVLYYCFAPASWDNFEDDKKDP